MKSNWIVESVYLFSTFAFCDSSPMKIAEERQNRSLSPGDVANFIQNKMEMEELNNFTSTFIQSSFHVKHGLSRRDQQKQWYTDGSKRSIDCFCEVTINGLHHASAEDAVCGTRGRISCDRSVGCQKATAVVRGSHHSIVKSCGDYELAAPNCRQHREQDPHLGHQIVIQRCFCLGSLCNQAQPSPKIHSISFLVTLVFSLFDIL